jgi:thioredoxin family protein
VYSDPQVVDFVEQHFTPVRVHVQRNRDEYKRLGTRFGAHWTPTILFVDAKGEEAHRVEGFLPRGDFLGQLALGLAKVAFAQEDYARAAPLFRQVVDQSGETDAAPEALYWAGVSDYRATDDPAALAETTRAFGQRYQDSTWAKKASVWGSAPPPSS